MSAVLAAIGRMAWRIEYSLEEAALRHEAAGNGLAAWFCRLAIAIMRGASK